MKLTNIILIAIIVPILGKCGFSGRDESQLRSVQYNESSSELFSVNSALTQWHSQMLEKGVAMQENGQMPETGLIECKKTAEVENTYLCASFDALSMNRTFTRVSVFSEGLYGFEQGTIISHEAAELEEMHETIGGHDLPLKAFKEFSEAVVGLCASDEAYCLSEYENELYSHLIEPISSGDENAVIISFSAQGYYPYREVVSHEMLHAQFFLNQQYNALIREYWEFFLEDTDKKIVMETLSSIYDIENFELVLNEFQAYVLMEGSEFNMLADIAYRHKEILTEFLLENGVEPVALDTPEVNESMETSVLENYLRDLGMMN